MQLRRPLAFTLGLKLVINHPQPFIFFLQCMRASATAPWAFKLITTPPTSQTVETLPLQCTPFHFPPRKVLASSLLLAVSVLQLQPRSSLSTIGGGGVRGLPPRAVPDTNWLGWVPGETDSEGKIGAQRVIWSSSLEPLQEVREAGPGR